MNKTVTVLERRDKEVKVGCDTSLCDGCRSKMFCSGRDTTFDVTIPKGTDVREGEKIEIEVPEGRAVLSVLLSLGLPLLLFLPGYYISGLFLTNEIAKALCGFGAMALGFISSFVIFRARKSYFTPFYKGKAE